MVEMYNPFGKGRVKLVVYNDDGSETIHNLSNNYKYISFNKYPAKFRYIVKNKTIYDPNKPIIYDIKIGGFCNYIIWNTYGIIPILYKMGDIDTIVYKITSSPSSNDCDEYCKKLIELNPYTTINGPNIVHYYAHYVCKNDPDTAESYYKLGIKLDIKNMRIYYAEFLNSLKRYKEMEEQYLICIKNGNTDAMAKMGNYLMKTVGDNIGAEHYFNMAIDGENMEPLNELVKYYISNNKYDKYEELIKKVIKIRPNISDLDTVKSYIVFYSVVSNAIIFGDYYLMKGDPTTALQCYLLLVKGDITKPNIKFKCYTELIDSANGLIKSIKDRLKNDDISEDARIELNNIVNELMNKKAMYKDVFCVT